MKIGIVILNYLNWQDTVECVDSLSEQTNQDFEMIVVDNFSNNESVERLTEKYRHLKNFHLIETKQNLGFAKGNNIGIQYCMNKLKIQNILVTNNDVIFTDKDYIQKLMNLPLDNKVGAYGTRIIGLDGLNQNPLKYTPGFYEVLRELLFPLVKVIKNIIRHNRIRIDDTQDSAVANESSTEIQYDYVLHGSVIYFTQNYLSQMQGFYPETFLYYEENILGIVFKKLDLEMKYVDDFEILHKEDQSSNLSFNNESGVKYRLGRESVKIASKLLFKSPKKIKTITNRYPYDYDVIVSSKS